MYAKALQAVGSTPQAPTPPQAPAAVWHMKPPGQSGLCRHAMASHGPSAATLTPAWPAEHSLS